LLLLLLLLLLVVVVQMPRASLVSGPLFWAVLR
jgi:hypothetical protein